MHEVSIGKRSSKKLKISETVMTTFFYSIRNENRQENVTIFPWRRYNNTQNLQPTLFSLTRKEWHFLVYT